MASWWIKVLARINSVCTMSSMDWHQILGLPYQSEWPALTKECLSEFIGTLFIVLFGCGAAISGTDNSTIALSFGLAVFIAVHLTSPLSGAYLNPALSFAALITGRLGLARMFLFILTQCLGAISGAFLLHVLIPDTNHNYGVNVLSLKFNETCDPDLFMNDTLACLDFANSVAPLNGVLIEMVAMFVLTLVVLSLTDPGAEQYWCPPLIVGLTVTLCHIFAIPYTKCSINPARSFGPAVVSGIFEFHWIFWLGPFSGAALAAIIHVLLYQINVKERYQVTKPETLKKTAENIDMEKL